MSEIKISKEHQSILDKYKGKFPYQIISCANDLGIDIYINKKMEKDIYAELIKDDDDHFSINIKAPKLLQTQAGQQ